VNENDVLDEPAILSTERKVDEDRLSQLHALKERLNAITKAGVVLNETCARVRDNLA
jgi:hypothetical protein